MRGLSWFNSQFPATVGIGETGNLGWLQQPGDKDGFLPALTE